jgi:hypothetical protein
MNNIKKFENFNNNDNGGKERIPIMEFIKPFMDSQFFIDEELDDYIEEESINNFISEFIIDGYSLKFFEKEGNFPYKSIKSWRERGDGRDESYSYSVFERKSDGKLFLIWIHDDGQIGPSALSCCEYAEEVKKKKVTSSTYE